MNLYTWQTADSFHKVFLRNRGWFAELDTCADPHYDASGLGRIHRRGAPSALCLSVPCPAEPGYSIGDVEAMALAIAPGLMQDDRWHFAAEKDVQNTVITHGIDKDTVYVVMESRWPDGRRTEMNCRMKSDRLEIFVTAGEKVALLIPAFAFDGECSPEQSFTEHCLRVRYQGWVCSYTSPESIRNLQKTAYNRNGHYRAFAVEGDHALSCKITIMPEKA